MKVNNQSVEYDNCWKHFRTVIDDTYYEEHLKLKRKFEFLREVAYDGMFNGLLMVGPKGFDKFSMEHNGEAWVIKMEATVPK